MSADPVIPPSSAYVAAQLVVEGCLPMIEGTVRGEFPVRPEPLDGAERDRLGVAEDELAMFYPAGAGGVFFLARPTRIRVFFVGDDLESATDSLHRALVFSYPQAQQLDDVPARHDPRLRARAYRVELSGGRLAAISTSFIGEGDNMRFEILVQAQVRPS